MIRTFFNSGTCLTAQEGNVGIHLCGSEKPTSNGLTAIRNYPLKGNVKVVYCEPEISNYVTGVPTLERRGHK